MSCPHTILFALATQSLPGLLLRQAMACGAQPLLAQACVRKGMAAFSQFWLLHGPDMGEVHGWWLLRKQVEHKVRRMDRHGTLNNVWALLA